MKLSARFMEGFNWVPYRPYTTTLDERIRRGVCNALSLHARRNDGSWVSGYEGFCRHCGMHFGRWTQEKTDAIFGAVNALPPNEQWNELARLSGGWHVERDGRGRLP